MGEHAHTHEAGHGDGYYVKIWALLCVLLAVSIVGPMFGIRVVTLITAFGIAIVKAYLVAKHFMHLGIEKRWVAYILLAMMAFMVVMFGGVAPDVLEHRGHNWEKTYVEPAVTHHDGVAEHGAE
jgi:caa(3)-type oxidase subunit IV